MARFSGLSFPCDFAYAAFGGLTPAPVGMLAPLDPAPAHYVVTLSVVGVMTGVYLSRRGGGGKIAAKKAN
jgi:hypothetical protein